MKKFILAASIISLAVPFFSLAETYKYEPTTVTIRGKLLSAPGETQDGKKITFPAIQLTKPITVEGDQETWQRRTMLIALKTKTTQQPSNSTI